jgi:Flp pilus assembly protein TadD
MMNNDDPSDIDDSMDDYDQDQEDLNIGSDPIQTRSRGGGSPLMKFMLPAVALIAVAGAGGFYLLKDKTSPAEYVVQASEPQVPDQAAQPPQPVAFTSETPAPPAQTPEQPDALGKLENEVLASNDVPRGPEDGAGPIPAAPDEAPPAAATPEQPAVVGSPSAPPSVAEPPALAEPAPQPQILGATPLAEPEPPVAVATVIETTTPPPPMPAPSEAAPPAAAVPVSDAMTPPPAESAGQAAAMAPVTGDSSVSRIESASASDQPDTYYDSSLNVPTGPMADAVGPRKVDPVQEPASKFIIASKTYDGSDVESQLVAANRALDLGRYESALEMFDQLYKRNDRDGRILMGRAVAQQKLGRDDEAIVSYESLLEIAPENTNAVINLMGLIQKQYPSVAQRRLLDLQAKYPGNAGIAAQLGMTFAQTGDNNEALRFLGMAASLEPRNASHLYNMAVITDRMGNTARAISYYQQALEIDAVYGNGRSVPREAIYDRLAHLRTR